MNLNGIRFLKAHTDYPVNELRKRYREPSRSRTFIDRCLLAAECCVTLRRESIDPDQLHYNFATEAEYLDPEGNYHFLADSKLVRPSLCIETLGGEQEDYDVTYSLLEIFDATLPRHRLRKRLKNYVQYLEEDEWRIETDTEELPVILLVLPTLTDLIYAKRCIKKLLDDIYYEDIPEDIHIRFTTTEKLAQHGITSRIWEEKRVLHTLH